MSLFQKLVLFMLGATIVPFSVVGFALVRNAEDALRDRIRGEQVERVVAEAQAVRDLVSERVDDLRRAAVTFDLSGATEAELEGAVRVLYRVAPDVAITVLLDDQGDPVAAPAYLEDPERVPELRDHPPADDAAVMRLRSFVPLERALTEGAGAVVLSPVYATPERGTTAMAVALPVARVEGGLLIFAAEVSLGAIQRRVAERKSAGDLVVVDGDGRLVAHPDPARLREEPDAVLLASATVGDEAGSRRLPPPPGEDTGPRLAAHAPVPLGGLGWWVGATLAEREAFAPVRQMRVTILLSSSAALVLLLGLGAWLTRRLRRGLRAVEQGAEQFSKGNLDHRIDPPSERELEELANTFNAMGGELGAAKKRLERWNEDLQEQVEIRTRELKEAQAQLVQTQKLAAVGQLGAGVAHEINNPLAGILGNVQLLIMLAQKRGAEEKDISMLKKVEGAAKRCREITQALLRFSQQTDEARREEIAINDVVLDVLRLAGEGDEAIRVEHTLADPSPRLNGDAGHLSQVVLHLLTNARTALAEKGGTVRLTTTSENGHVVLRVADDGKGIDPAIKSRIFEPFFTTKDEWTSLGLGLSVSFRIIEDHGGRIEVDSEPGKGTRVTVTLPGA